MIFSVYFRPLFVVCILGIFSYSTQETIEARWCASSQGEYDKCVELKEVLRNMRNEGHKVSGIDKTPTFSCVRGIDTFDCLEKIEKDQADLINLDSGLCYFGGRYHSLIPVVAETYSDDTNAPAQFNAVIVVKRGSDVTLETLAGRKSCHPGIGNSAGWIYPVGRLMELGYIDVQECNSPVSSVNELFSSGMCLPGAINSFFNAFGNNPVTACGLCQGHGDGWCSSGDPYHGYDGALRCLIESGDVAFVREDTVRLFHDSQKGATGLKTTADDFELLCPDGTRKTVDEHGECNWGAPQSHVVMTSGVKTPSEITSYTYLFKKISDWFKFGGLYYARFRAFESRKYYQASSKLNLMFTDGTKSLLGVGNRDSYYTWVGAEFMKNLESIERCPLSTMRWCVISKEEKKKCEDMLMAFKARGLKPELDCVLGATTDVCMRMIRYGDADVMTLDAADTYYAGRIYGLAPIAQEDYGDMTGKYHVVAVTHKREGKLTLFNLLGRRTCHGGVRTADGFVIPAHIMIDTTQIRPYECSLYQSMGELLSRSCIPGVLEKEYNPKMKPVNLCESCAAGAEKKCQRNANELYYKSTGAFRCLVENGGDVAFTRHSTAQDNTDGKSQALWARNRRSDDYELMCKDGSRRPIAQWKQCNLGSVPGNAVVTSGLKSAMERKIYWNVLNHAQMYFSSDLDADFAMFHSGLVHNDLLFSDACVRLIEIPPKNQTYEQYLGPEFKYAVSSLIEYTCDLNQDMIRRYHPSAGNSVIPFIFSSLIFLIVTILLL